VWNNRRLQFASYREFPINKGKKSPAVKENSTKKARRKLASLTKAAIGMWRKTGKSKTNDSKNNVNLLIFGKPGKLYPYLQYD
jgi:hypothetical protein